MRLRLTNDGWSSGPEEIIDCIVVGGGPAGLTAAIYLSRFLRSCAVFDAGSGRAASIPRSHNLPGFPEGIPGVELLARMQTQLREFGGTIQSGEVHSIAPSDEGFLVSCDLEVLRARTVILATGVVNHRPEMPAMMHDIGVASGLIRYCPVCDGYEARGMNIAVIGSSEHGAAEAQFLMSYGSRVTLLAQNSLDLSRSDIAELAHRGIEVARSPIQQLNVASDQVEVSLEDGQQLRFDTLYPALGSSPRTRLATAIGARLSSSGCLLTDLHQQTSVPGLFAAGDVVEGLDQISVAIGQAAKAATAIHNLLRDRDDEVALAKETSGISHPRSI